MEQLNQADDNCKICGKSKTGVAGLSLTQWIFNSETCRCDSTQFATNPNMCRFCGKALTKGSFETMTQWIFHPDVCSCGVENQDFLASVHSAASSQQNSSGSATADNTVSLSPRAAFIYELVNGEINYHGLPVESFPFERFRIIEEVGRGGAGVVYQAWDCLLKRRVAIKTMHATVSSPEEVIKLQNEARTSSRLTHPAIIRILDLGAAPNGQPYLVSDFIDGTTLKSRLDTNGPLSMTEALQTFTQLCAGIIHAHEQSVLHRDLKSSNVMISDDTNDGTNIKIIDFGVARLREALFQTSELVETVTLVGTPYYMSPEQASGKAFDARSEIYSIGCMMFEALTGQVPFKGETALETLAMHTRERVPELADINPDVDCSEKLESIIFRCLEKDPNERFQTVADLYKQLNSCPTQSISEPPDTESQTDPNQEAKRQNTNRRTAVAMCSTLLGLLVVVWGVSTILTETGVSEKTEINSKSKEGSNKRTPEKESPDTFFEAPLFTDKKPWHDLSTGIWVGSMWLKDQDFLELKKKSPINWVESTLSSDITGEGLKYVKNRQIRNLHLNSESLSDVALNNIGEMKSLEFLTLGATHKLSADKLQVLRTLPKLGTLKLQDVTHPPTILELLADRKMIVILLLMDKPPGSGKTNWAPLASMGRLRIFDVLNYDFTDADVKYIKCLNNLNELRLSDLGLRDFEANKLIVAPLQILDLSCNRITDKTVAKLGSIKTLKELDLSGCSGVTADGIEKLQSKLPKCEIIFRTDNKPDRDEWSIFNLARRIRALYDAEHKP